MVGIYKPIRLNLNILEERKKSSGFNEYILNRYKMKGKRAIKFSEGIDELDILLGIKKASKFDEEDLKYLNEVQLKQLERIKKIDIDFKKL